MQKAILVGAVFLLAGVATAIPAAEAPKIMVGQGPLSEDLFLQGFGGVAPEKVRIITYAPDPVERFVPYNEFRAAFMQTSLGHAMSTDNHVGPSPVATLTGSDEGNGILNGPGFCDNSSPWIVYDKGLSLGGSGSSYLVANDNGALPITTCGGFFGPTHDWEIQMSILPNLLGQAPRLTTGYEGCYATIWTNHANGYCPGQFTNLDTFVTFNLDGPGVRTTLDGGNVWFDYVLGNGADVSYGLL